MATVSEILSAAADLIETRGWTQGAAARDPKGAAVDGQDPDACCWCAIGAINRATPARSFEEFQAAMTTVERVLELPSERDTWGLYPLASWNDDPSRTQAEVVQALRQASEKGRSE